MKKFVIVLVVILLASTALADRKLKKLKRAEPWCGKVTVASPAEDDLGPFSVVIAACAVKKTTCEMIVAAFESNAPGSVRVEECHQ